LSIPPALRLSVGHPVLLGMSETRYSKCLILRKLG